MHLIQILLPLCDHEHRALPRSLFAEVEAELTEEYGGITAHVRSPVEGHWKEAGIEARDDSVIYEVMTDRLDEAWWHAFRNALASRFKQGEIIIRALPMQLL